MNAEQPVVPRIWVFVEQQEHQVHPVSWELLGAAKRLSADLPGSVVEAVLPGHQIAGLAPQAFHYGAARVYVIDSPVLEIYRNLPYAVAVSQLVMQYRPEIFLIGATTLGRDLAGSIATRVGTGLTADCTELAIDPAQHILAATRPTFGGNLMATILCRRHRPQMATVRPRVLPMPDPILDATGEVITVPFDMREEDVPVKRLRLIRAEEQPNIEYADVLVAGGRGVGGPAARWSMPDGWMPVGRSGRRARRCDPNCTLRRVSPAPSSIESA
jgi:electron transfer flavoprotein alpha subunit